MLAGKTIKLLPQSQKLAQQTRNMSVVSGPPTVKITPAEKIIHGLIMTVGFAAIPSWVLVNIKHYKE